MAALFAAFVLSSCSEPTSSELFVRSDKAQDGVYIFEVPLNDSLSHYTFSFYSRSTGKMLRGVNLKVRWLAPSGDGMDENVYMKEIAPRGSSEVYRSGVVPAECGTWQISVRPDVAKGDIEGFGLITQKTDGTR